MNEPLSSKQQCACVYATAENTPGVRDGHEVSGYLKEECAMHKEQPASKNLVTRLLEWSGEIDSLPEYKNLVTDAADEIERLEHKCATLKEWADTDIARLTAERDEFEANLTIAERQVTEAQAERDRLKHDVERYIAINSELATELAHARAEAKAMHSAYETSVKLRAADPLREHWEANKDKWLNKLADAIERAPDSADDKL